MSWIEKAEQQLANHSTTLRAVDTLRQLVEHAIEHKTDVRAVLHVIKATFDALVNGFEGKVDKAEIEKHLDELTARLADVDTTADRALDEKFGKDPT